VTSILELHDSQVAGITRRGAFVCVDFVPGYFHWSAGQPGRDPGTGWTQEATLWFSEPEITGAIPDLPCEAQDGELRAGADIYPNSIPVPFDTPERVELLMVFSPEQRVSVVGSGGWLELLGDPKFVDDFCP
jgi:hypothetical protein